MSISLPQGVYSVSSKKRENGAQGEKGERRRRPFPQTDLHFGVERTGKSDRLRGDAPGKERLRVPAVPTTTPTLEVLAGGFTASILYRGNHQLGFVNRVIMRTNSYISPTAKPFYYGISKTNTWILNFNTYLHFKTLNYPAKRTWMWRKAISSIISLNLKVLIYFNKSRCPYARKLTSKNVKYAQYHLKAMEY